MNDDMMLKRLENLEYKIDLMGEILMRSLPSALKRLVGDDGKPFYKPYDDWTDWAQNRNNELSPFRHNVY